MWFRWLLGFIISIAADARDSLISFIFFTDTIAARKGVRGPELHSVASAYNHRIDSNTVARQWTDLEPTNNDGSQTKRSSDEPRKTPLANPQNDRFPTERSGDELLSADLRVRALVAALTNCQRVLGSLANCYTVAGTDLEPINNDRAAAERNGDELVKALLANPKLVCTTSKPPRRNLLDPRPCDGSITLGSSKQRFDIVRGMVHMGGTKWVTALRDWLKLRNSSLDLLDVSINGVRFDNERKQKLKAMLDSPVDAWEVVDTIFNYIVSSEELLRARQEVERHVKKFENAFTSGRRSGNRGRGSMAESPKARCRLSRGKDFIPPASARVEIRGVEYERVISESDTEQTRGSSVFYSNASSHTPYLIIIHDAYLVVEYRLVSLGDRGLIPEVFLRLSQAILKAHSQNIVLGPRLNLGNIEWDISVGNDGLPCVKFKNVPMPTSPNGPPTPPPKLVVPELISDSSGSSTKESDIYTAPFVLFQLTEQIEDLVQKSTDCASRVQVPDGVTAPRQYTYSSMVSSIPVVLDQGMVRIPDSIMKNEPLLHIVNMCLSHDPSQRPTAEGLCKLLLGLCRSALLRSATKAIGKSFLSCLKRLTPVG